MNRSATAAPRSSTSNTTSSSNTRRSALRASAGLDSTTHPVTTRGAAAQAPRRWFSLLALLLMLVSAPAMAWAADLEVRSLVLDPCPAADVGAQPELRRPSGASCYALRGEVFNPGRQPVVDTDLFALILDASGEPVLPNRSRVGSIGDVPPGLSTFALRLAVPAGTPGPFVVRQAKARGFRAPVRSRAGAEDEQLPLEQALAG